MRSLAIAFAGASIVACAQPGEEELGATRQASTSENAYSKNAYSKNAYSKNAYSKNAYSKNSLSEYDMANMPCETAQYATRCALRPDQAQAFDGCGIYAGALGLATYWPVEPLTEEDEQLIHACLAAHVNTLGIPVQISVRGEPASLWASELEKSHFTTHHLTLWMQGGLVHVCSTRTSAYGIDTGRPVGAVWVDFMNQGEAEPLAAYAGFCDDNRTTGVCDYEDPDQGYFSQCGDAQSAGTALTVFLGASGDGGSDPLGGNGGTSL